MANPSLSAKQQRSIEALIRKWSTKLSWALLVKSIELEFGIVTTRQTLSTYNGIKNEFDTKKQELRGASPEITKVITLGDIELHKRLNDYKAKNEVLEKQVAKQLRLIETIFANASEIPNIDLNELIKARPEG